MVVQPVPMTFGGANKIKLGESSLSVLDLFRTADK